MLPTLTDTISLFSPFRVIALLPTTNFMSYFTSSSCTFPIRSTISWQASCHLGRVSPQGSHFIPTTADSNSSCSATAISYCTELLTAFRSGRVEQTAETFASARCRLMGIWSFTPMAAELSGRPELIAILDLSLRCRTTRMSLFTSLTMRCGLQAPTNKRRIRCLTY